MAAMAASLMGCGVGKWGSPAPKSTRLTPWARSLAASADTASVAETSIRPMRPVKTWEGELTVVIIYSILQIFGLEQNGGGKIGGLAAQNNIKLLRQWGVCL